MMTMMIIIIKMLQPILFHMRVDKTVIQTSRERIVQTNFANRLKWFTEKIRPKRRVYIW